MIIPELPSFLSALGGGEYKGLIIALFTVTAMISRPFSGKLSDTIGRVPVMVAGSAVCLVCSLIYPLTSTVFAFLLLRLLHGFSTGFTPTGQTALLSDIIPAERRGEAMGILGTAGSVGMAGGFSIGGWIASAYSHQVLFYSSAICAFVSVAIILGTKETLKERKRFHPSLLKVDTADLFDFRVIIPCLVMVLCAYAYGATVTLIPDYGEHYGIENKGLLFTYLTVASLVVRLLAGKASDAYGRVPVLRVSSALIALSMLVMALAETKLHLIIGVTLYGLAQGSTSPTLLAWATDLSNPNNKGRGIASVYIAMEFGIGMGAFISGLVYSNEVTNFLPAFVTCSALALMAFVFLVNRNKRRIQTPVS